MSFYKTSNKIRIPVWALMCLYGLTLVVIPLHSQEYDEFETPRTRDLPQLTHGTGAGHWFYEAKKAELLTDTSAEGIEAIEFQFLLAFRFGIAPEAAEAGRELMGRLLAKGDSIGARDVSLEWLDSFGADWDVYKALHKAQLALGDIDGALGTVDAMAKNLATTAKSRSTELAYMGHSARAAKGDMSWVESQLPLAHSTRMDSWIARSLRLAASQYDLEPETRALALFRANFFEKQYQDASKNAKDCIEVLKTPGTSRTLVSEAGRAFISSSMLVEGIELFSEFFASAGNSADSVATIISIRDVEERLWVAAYYLARLWLADGRETQAAILFMALTEFAPSFGDSDSALWYWLDITIKHIAQRDIGELGTSRSLELGALAEASQRWKNSSSFDDIIERYTRNLLKAKVWNDAVTLFALLKGTLSQSMTTKLMYLSARLVQEGLADIAAAGVQDRGVFEYSRDYYQTIAKNPHAEEYYRTLSAWRLRETPPFLASMPDLSSLGLQDGKPGSIGPLLSAEAQRAGSNGNLTLIENFLANDLEELASTLAVKYLGSSDKALVASLAFELSAAGQHYSALRLARDAVARGSGSQFPALYGLVYPRPWNDIVRRGAEIPGIPEALAYGLIRSESVFDPKVVSYAGAVGLAQLMPATAAETAKGLKMNSYSLTDPEDNVRLGMTYYSYMMARFGKKPMRAMFAYNAGPGRMTTWHRESGELPDDILLETLHLAQPRQYAKNIIQATLAYSKIHYAIDPLAMLDYLVNGIPIPVAVVVPIALPEVDTDEAGTDEAGLAETMPIEEFEEAKE